MSKVRNATDGPLEVSMLDRVVAAGEEAEVPDFQPAHSDANPLPIVWPPPVWEYVRDDRIPAADGGTGAGGSGDESGAM